MVNTMVVSDQNLNSKISKFAMISELELKQIMSDRSVYHAESVARDTPSKSVTRMQQELDFMFDEIFRNNK